MYPCVRSCVCPVCVLGAGDGALLGDGFTLGGSEVQAVLSLGGHSPVISCLPSQSVPMPAGPQLEENQVAMGLKEGTT